MMSLIFSLALLQLCVHAGIGSGNGPYPGYYKPEMEAAPPMQDDSKLQRFYSWGGKGDVPQHFGPRGSSIITYSAIKGGYGTGSGLSPPIGSGTFGPLSGYKQSNESVLKPVQLSNQVLVQVSNESVGQSSNQSEFQPNLQSALVSLQPSSQQQAQASYQSVAQASGQPLKLNRGPHFPVLSKLFSGTRPAQTPSFVTSVLQPAQLRYQSVTRSQQQALVGSQQPQAIFQSAAQHGSQQPAQIQYQYVAPLLCQQPAQASYQSVAQPSIQQLAQPSRGQRAQLLPDGSKLFSGTRPAQIPSFGYQSVIQSSHQQSHPSYQSVAQPSGQQPAEPSGQQPSYQSVAQPSGQQPAEPSGQQPAEPSGQQPAEPSGQQPSYQSVAQPSGQQPAEPSGQQPSYQSVAQPSGQQPAEPSGQQPAEPSGQQPSYQSVAQPSGQPPAEPSGQQPSYQPVAQPSGQQPAEPSGQQPSYQSVAQPSGQPPAEPSGQQPSYQPVAQPSGQQLAKPSRGQRVQLLPVGSKLSGTRPAQIPSFGYQSVIQSSRQQSHPSYQSVAEPSSQQPAQVSYPSVAWPSGQSFKPVHSQKGQLHRIGGKLFNCFESVSQPSGQLVAQPGLSRYPSPSRPSSLAPHKPVVPPSHQPSSRLPQTMFQSMSIPAQPLGSLKQSSYQPQLLPSQPHLPQLVQPSYVPLAKQGPSRYSVSQAAQPSYPSVAQPSSQQPNYQYFSLPGQHQRYLPSIEPGQSRYATVSPPNDLSLSSSLASAFQPLQPGFQDPAQMRFQTGFSQNVLSAPSKHHLSWSKVGQLQQVKS